MSGKARSWWGAVTALAMLCGLTFWMGGCESSAQTGALAGGGMGALIGQAAGGSTEATLIGAAVGTGVGYVIGNEKDKQDAKAMSANSKPPAYNHTQVDPLGGTRWLLVSLVPQDFAEPYTSKIFEFRSQGHVITTTTFADGTVKVDDEHYRVVGDTLIVNKPGYLINAQFAVAGDQLIVTAPEFRAVLKRMVR